MGDNAFDMKKLQEFNNNNKMRCCTKKAEDEIQVTHLEFERINIHKLISCS